MSSPNECQRGPAREQARSACGAHPIERGPRHAIEYLIVVPVPFHADQSGRFFGESAFCEHLRLLQRMLEPEFERLVVAAPRMTEAEYAQKRAHLGVLDPAQDSITYVPLHRADAGHARFWLAEAAPALLRILRAVLRAHLVHSGPSHDLWRPIELAALLFGALFGRRTICVQDIDLRRDAAMNRATGRWSRGTYLRCRYFYDPLRDLQMRLLVRTSSLCLFKGRAMCADYGRGRASVRDFFDVAFSREHLISAEDLASKVARLRDPAVPLELVYFGRLAAYKGVDRCLEALALLAPQIRARVRFHVIGTGEEDESLRRAVAEQGLERCVAFHGPLRFGPELFERVRACDLLLATPLSEDTPRSAFDAFASAVPVLAFDTAYYADLVASGAVEIVPWPSARELSTRIAAFAADKSRLVPLAENAIAFARENTQEAWLARRVAWTRDLFAKHVDAAARAHAGDAKHAARGKARSDARDDVEHEERRGDEHELHRDAASSARDGERDARAG